MTPERIKELWDMAGGFRESINGGPFELVIDEQNAPYLITLIERDFIQRSRTIADSKAVDKNCADGYGCMGADLRSD